MEAKASSKQPETAEEVDLSDEWASMLEDTHPAEPVTQAPPAKPELPAKPAPPPPPVVEAEPVAAEEFSIKEEPVVAEGKKSPELTGFELPEELPALEEKPQATTSTPVETAPAEKAKTVPPPAKETRPAAEKPTPPSKSPAAEKPAAPAKPSKPVEPQPEFELEQEYELVLDQEDLVPAYDQKAPEPPPVAKKPEPEPAQSTKDSAGAGEGGFASDQFLADLAKEIDDLGLDELVPSHSEAAAEPVAPKAETKPAPAGEPSPLKEVFEEFRAELGEMGAEDEDLETHYNLGIAFREMGLVDEAISEFQKVAKATDNGKPFRYGMQCCTLLGLCFMDKGQPAIAAIWYERALLTPGIEPESVLALRYDLGVAQESAGEQDAALKSFSQVYAMNIDYRDVADRIASLQKPTR